MASDPTGPLRTMSNRASTKKSPAPSRALQEISPMGIRRNSPSFNQATKKPMFLNNDSSPFEASKRGNSPRLLYWKQRESASPGGASENDSSPSPSPNRRVSVEALKQKSRVRNTNFYNLEQDQDSELDNSSLLDKPKKPLGTIAQGNAWGGTGLSRMTRNEPSPPKGLLAETTSKLAILNPLSVMLGLSKPISPSKEQTSPQKSSFASTSKFGVPGTFYGEDSIPHSEDGVEGTETRGTTPRQALRQHKSVTFDEAPPQINEYEMATPDPSSIASGSREGSLESDEEHSIEKHQEEDSFDESLEDAEKTPVVLPEDWKFMSPQTANKDLVRDFDDPFDAHMANQSPNLNSQRVFRYEGGLTRSDSIMSNGERRPLPALPVVLAPVVEREDTPLPINPHQSQAKSSSDTSNLRIDAPESEPLHNLMHQLAIADEHSVGQTEIQLGDTIANNEVIEGPCDPVAIALEVAAQQAEVEQSQEITHRTPSYASQTSTKERADEQESSEHEPYLHSFSAASAHPGHAIRLDYANLDPDVPIPSREPSSNYEDEAAAMVIKEEPVEDEANLYDYPEQQPLPESLLEDGDDDYARESSVIHRDLGEFVEDVPLDEKVQPEELNSREEITDQSASRSAEKHLHSGAEDEYSFTNEDHIAPAKEESLNQHKQYSDALGLPRLDSFMRSDDFGLSFQSYLTPPQLNEPHTDNGVSSKIDYFASLQRPATPPAQIEREVPEEPGTPDSVIHHSVDSDAASVESEFIPAPTATIKAPGSRLKTRPSATPADLQTMAAARRIASGEMAPPVSIDAAVAAPSVTSELLVDNEKYTDEGPMEGEAPGTLNDDHDYNDADDCEHEVEVEEEQRKGDLMLDIALPDIGTGLDLGLDEDFNQVVETQKKGYLMRQNTKLVVASHRRISEDQRPGSRKASASGYKPAGTRKPSAQTWTTEPWNGKIRRHSTRRSSISPVKPHNLGPVPPMPGHESNAIAENGLLGEDQLDDLDPTGERGRLFVKVVGLKDLKLPLPKNERSWFQLTLDNGLHCVTTAWLELGRSAPIGQEFELTVFDDLEFTLTLQTKLERPKQVNILPVVTTSPQKQQKTSLFGRFMTSPKKRKELERKQQEEEALAAMRMQEEREAQRARQHPTAWDLQHEIVGSDGSFARAYVNLGDHEAQAFGRPLTVDIPAYNEWSMEDKTIASSTRSKLGGVQRRPPYEIGKLELHLLYIPKPKGAKDEDMPKSMSSCIRQLKEAENNVSKKWEGFLSQQGGDCPYWRRRFFKLDGSKLTAYHESTLQRRVTINLAKASKLIDDKSSLTKNDNNSPGKAGRSRRKSAFAEDEEGYMFVEEGFRIRFANGEVIDFYAENAAQKDDWMKALADVVGKENATEKQTWVTAVLARHKADAAAAAAAKSANNSKPSEDKVQTGAARLAQARPASVVAPMSSPAKAPVYKPAPVVSPMKAERVLPKTSEMPTRTSSQRSAGPAPQTRMQKLTGSGRRNAIKSMIF